MKTYLEFNDGKSYKFWQIETEGNSHKVTFGRIGTTGQETFKEFSSSDQALKDAEKLIESKLKKGYEKKDNSSEKKVSKHIGLTYEETEEGVSIIPKLDKLIKDPTTGSLTELIIGYWDENYSQKNSAHVVEFLATHANSFPNLKHVFIGDISQEESEISWINQCDLSPLLNAFPALESLRVRGSTDLAFSKLNHNALKTLIIESGGLPKSVIQSISNANLPELEHLELYLGVEEYGFDGSIDTIKPLLKKGLFPKLKYLGLRDSEIADEIAKTIANADILDQLDTLDLSLGTLTDVGAKAFLSSEKIKNLKKLDLHYHFMSPDMVKQLRKTGVTINAEDPQEADKDSDGTIYRYPQVTE